MSEYKDYGWEENESYSVKVLFNDCSGLTILDTKIAL